MNYGLLLLAHIICADQQLHSEEIRYLDELIRMLKDKLTDDILHNLVSSENENQINNLNANNLNNVIEEFSN